MSTPQTCSICHGEGTVDDKWSGKKIECKNCAGTGMIVDEQGPPPADPGEEPPVKK